jgi:hypothetical protein
MMVVIIQFDSSFSTCLLNRQGTFIKTALAKERNKKENRYTFKQGKKQGNLHHLGNNTNSINAIALRRENYIKLKLRGQ